MTANPAQRWQREQLGYCSNVHAGETLDEVRQVVSGHISAVRALRGLESMMAGLWVSAECADRLSRNPDELQRFGELLKDSGIEVCTLNGFPYGNFHSEVVKASVYEPDWSEMKRFAYTLNLARLLAELLPDSQPFGTISTLPLGYSKNWSEAQQNLSVSTLIRLAQALEEIEAETGRRIVVCLEMEPDCVLERTSQLLKLFDKDLPATAEDTPVSTDMIRRYLGVCFDICHQAVMFEDPAESLQKIHKAGIFVGKIQVSSALEIVRPDTPELIAALKEFDEPRYLHQVRARNADGAVASCADLGTALNDESFDRNALWRIHFHVPVQAAELTLPQLRTTRRLIEGVFDVLKKTPGLHPHLEVETYSWKRLPEALRAGNHSELHTGLAQEITWTEQALRSRDLL